MTQRRSFTEAWNLIRQRQGVESLGAHLEVRYGIGPVTLTQLDGGVYRVEKNDDEPWVARMFPSVRSMDRVDGDARILRVLEEHECAAERLAHSDPVSRHEGQGVLVTASSTVHPSPVLTSKCFSPSASASAACTRCPCNRQPAAVAARFIRSPSKRARSATR